MKSNKHTRSQAQTMIVGLLIGLVIALMALIGAFWLINQKASHDKTYLANGAELRILSERIAKNASEAMSGNPDAFERLKNTRNEFESRYQILLNGDPNTGLPAASKQSKAIAAQMQTLSTGWTQVKGDVDSIIENEDVVLSLNDVAQTLTETIPQLEVEYDEVIQILLDADVSARQVHYAQEQVLRAERIVNSISRVLEGGDSAVMAAESFGRDAKDFGQTLRGMLEGDPERNIERVQSEDARLLLTDISDLFEFVSGSVDEILETSPELFLVREASNNTLVDTKTLLKSATNLVTSLEALSDERTMFEGNSYTAIIPGAIALLAILMLGWTTLNDTQVRLTETAEQNEENQQAILRLLDELADLADGDLTTQATVTENFTGAIADSINFTIENFRMLVETINKAAVSVAGAADETQTTAHHLAEAAEHQAQEIAGASAAINEMAVSIDQVSANAAESAQVSELSVSIANKGNEVVQNTIEGMDTIREQIQDTSKRIKRLGESSQEIGDIVSLINDIADQTNILSLNAAIQASMAGEAGRGFAVVADEVQRLAERSSSATKQIESLVKAIQTDTNEAVISMEMTTTEVVRGASLAQDAGVALEEIESVSKNLSGLISNISGAARQQASSAGHISNTMNVIQEITTQTSAGTNATAQSIGNLATLSSELREYVSGFKLPESNPTIITEETASS